MSLPFGKTPSAPQHQDDENNKLNTTIEYSWQAPPDTRGTYSIISSCLLTWGLCMWSAIHLNIPNRSWARWQWAGKCMWLIWGMCFPEIIAFQALEQNVLANELSKSVGNIMAFRNTSLSPHHNDLPERKKIKGWRDWFKLGKFQPASVQSGQTTQTESGTRYPHVSNLLDVEVKPPFHNSSSS